jgi:hypothetical protein
MAIMTDVFHGFLHYSQTSAKILPTLGNDQFLKNPYQYIIHQHHFIHRHISGLEPI